MEKKGDIMMKCKRFGDTVAVRLNRGEDIVSSIQTLSKKEGIKLATVSAIGAVDNVTFGLYDIEKREYKENRISKPLEIVSFCGNTTLKDGEPFLHLHASFADSDGNVFGGHLNEARVSATCEIFIKLIYGSIDRKSDDETGLYIFDI
jgi:predicted DNA-binding protein with PD1-like motif